MKVKYFLNENIYYLLEKLSFHYALKYIFKNIFWLIIMARFFSNIYIYVAKIKNKSAY